MSSDAEALSGGFKLPPAAHTTLGNGLRAYAMEYHELPLVEFEVIVGTGAAADPEGKEGIASLAAGLLRKGAGSRSAHEIADAVDFVGGSLSGSADSDATRLGAEFLAKDLDLGLDLMADMLMRPVFAQEEVDRLKGETLGDLQAVKENPSLLAGRRFVELLYKGHPYGHATPGWENTVASLTRDDVRRFYAAHYAPSEVIFVAVGDFKAEEMLHRIEQRFSSWSATAEARRPPPAPSSPARRGIYLVDKQDATQSQIRIGGIGIRRDDPDFLPLHVANTVLGGGFTSRLVEEIRVNRGLSYGVASRFYPLVSEGPFIISTFTKSATTQETIKVALDLLDRFRREGASVQEVDKARKYLRGSFAIEHQSPDAMADAMAEIAFYHLPGDYYDTYLDRIEAVTVDDIKRVASRFPSDRLVILVLGKAEEVENDLESLGPVTVLPLDSR